MVSSVDEMDRILNLRVADPDARFAMLLVGQVIACIILEVRGITSPLFTSFNDSRMASTNALNIVDYRLRAKMLSDSIPAESFAAGRNETSGVSGNYNYQSATPNGWPSNRDGWFHSDLKDVAFWYTYKLFEKIVKGE